VFIILNYAFPSFLLSNVTAMLITVMRGINNVTTRRASASISTARGEKVHFPHKKVDFPIAGGRFLLGAGRGGGGRTVQLRNSPLLSSPHSLHPSLPALSLPPCPPCPPLPVLPYPWISAFVSARVRVSRHEERVSTISQEG
jgi:hypothetical protein